VGFDIHCSVVMSSCNVAIRLSTSASGSDVDGAERFAERAIRRGRTSLPTRLQRLRAAQARAVGEVLVDERLRQRVAVRHREVRAEIRLPIGERRRRDERVDGFEELRMRDVEALDVRHAEALAEVLPFDVGRELHEIGKCRAVVARDGIAELDVRERCLRERRLEGEDVRGFLGGFGGLVAEEHEQVRDVLHVRVALRFLFVAEIVIAVREAEAALADLEDLLGAVLEIVACVGRERDVDADLLELPEFAGKRRRIGDRGDVGEHGRERLRSFGLDRGFVHARLVIAADLRFVRVGRMRVRRGGVEDAVEHVAVRVAQRDELAVRRICGGDRMVLDPRAVGEVVEIVACLARAIEFRDVEAGLERARCGRRRAERERHALRERGRAEDERGACAREAEEGASGHHRATRSGTAALRGGPCARLPGSSRRRRTRACFRACRSRDSAAQDADRSCRASARIAGDPSRPKSGRSRGRSAARA
jgi:hypothetical protein